MIYANICATFFHKSRANVFSTQHEILGRHHSEACRRPRFEALLLGGDEPSASPSPRGKVILPVQTLNRSFIKVLNCASDFEGAELEFYHVASSEEQAQALKAQFDELGVRGKFVYEITHFRNTEEVLLRHIEAEHDALPPHGHLTVMMASLVVRNRWARPLHNQTTQTLIRRMEQYRNVYVFQVPYLI